MSKNTETKVSGALTATCGEIRNIQDNCEQSFCILDDPIDEFTAHALISFSEKIKILSKNVKIAARANLMRVFGKIKDMSEIFS